MNIPVKYSIVIPVYNEESVLSVCYQRLSSVMSSLGESYEILFVDDGSVDGSGAVIEGLSDKDDAVKGIFLSRNFGHQIAITAGMDFSCGDAVIILDADLQDPPEIIPLFIEKWRQGFDVVCGKRTKRKGEGLLKKTTAALFYRCINIVSEVPIPYDTGDFRLLDRKVCDALKELREPHRFVRGLVSWTGFHQTEVPYVRDPRYSGKSKFSFRKMYAFALDALFSFSAKPLQIILPVGGTIFIAGLVVTIILLFLYFTPNTEVDVFFFFGALAATLNGLLLFFLGLIAEYIQRVHTQTKNRPLYFIQKVVGRDGDECKK